jgi:hypothetical protein
VPFDTGIVVVTWWMPDAQVSSAVIGDECTIGVPLGAHAGGASGVGGGASGR